MNNNKEGKGKICCKCERLALSLWRWGGCWREGASCQAVGHWEVQQPRLLGHLQALPAIMVTYFLTSSNNVLPEKLNCLWIKVAGVSCWEARWIYQPTDEKEGQTFTHIEPPRSKCGEGTKRETWSNGRRFCLKIIAISKVIEISKIIERPEATAVGFVHDLAHLLSQARRGFDPTHLKKHYHLQETFGQLWGTCVWNSMVCLSIHDSRLFCTCPIWEWIVLIKGLAGD